MKKTLLGLGIAVVVFSTTEAQARTTGVVAVPTISHYRKMTIRAAVDYCRSAKSVSARVSLTGYFRPGPLNHGPSRVSGSVFGSDSVPANAGPLYVEIDDYAEG
jgi:hypothetical protein